MGALLLASGRAERRSEQSEQTPCSTGLLPPPLPHLLHSCQGLRAKKQSDRSRERSLPPAKSKPRLTPPWQVRRTRQHR